MQKAFKKKGGKKKKSLPGEVTEQIFAFSWELFRVLWVRGFPADDPRGVTSAGTGGAQRSGSGLEMLEAPWRSAGGSCVLATKHQKKGVPRARRERRLPGAPRSGTGAPSGWQRRSRGLPGSGLAIALGDPVGFHGGHGLPRALQLPQPFRCTKLQFWALLPASSSLPPALPPNPAAAAPAAGRTAHKVSSPRGWGKAFLEGHFFFALGLRSWLAAEPGASYPRCCSRG